MDWENALWNGNIPMDLVKDVLLRLPAKALGRCMCTCKRLYSHIKSTEFITSHLNHSKVRDDTVLIVQEGCYSIFSESDPTLIKQESGTLIKQGSGRIPFPVIERDLYILGSCRGLVLVRLKVERGYLVLLWNPSLEKFKLVDTIIHDRPDGDEPERPQSSWLCVFALGFHEASNDYRVVRMTHRVDVYSFTNDNWHRVHGTLTNGKTLPSISKPGKMDCYINGAVHWLASYDEGDYWVAMSYLSEDELAVYEPEEERYVVLSFDFDNEVFKLIELPGHYNPNDYGYYPLELKELNGKLALFDGPPYPDPDENYDTWVMMNYPLVDSWTCIGCLFEHKLKYGKHDIWPMVCTKKENCIFKHIWKRKKDALRYFNAKEDKIYELEIVAPYECPVSVDFVDCLVLLDVENDALEVRTP